jgi:hypothetical protein
MNWEALGAIAEALGAVGVILTLAYLAQQIRQNNRLVASTIASSTRDAQNEVGRIIGSSVDAARVSASDFSDVTTSLPTSCSSSTPCSGWRSPGSMSVTFTD